MLTCIGGHLVDPLVLFVLVLALEAPPCDPVLLLVVPDHAVLLAVLDALGAGELLPLGQRLAARGGERLLARLREAVRRRDGRQRRERADVLVPHEGEGEDVVEEVLRRVARAREKVRLALARQHRARAGARTGGAGAALALSVGELGEVDAVRIDRGHEADVQLQRHVALLHLDRRRGGRGCRGGG